MIKPGALVMAAVMASVSAGTYYGLGFLPPGVLPPPIGRIPPAPLHAVAQNTAIVSTTATPIDAQPQAPAAATADPAATVATAAPTEQELAEEPAPKPAAPAPETKPAPEPAPESAPAPAAPKAKPQAAAKPAAAVPAEAVPEPPKEKAPAPKPAPQKTETAAEPSAPVTPSSTTAEADVIKQWWPEPSKLPANQLKLMYAGEVQGEPAVGLLFSSAPDMNSLKAHARVRDVSGADVAGAWEAGKNPRLVVLRGLLSGRYTVILDPELADTKGFALGQTLQGPVYIPKH